MWQGRIRRFLAKLGWGEEGPFVWRRPLEGVLQFRPGDTFHQRGSGLHSVKESWRREQWSGFISEDRRGSQLLATYQFDARRVKTRKKKIQRMREQCCVVVFAAWHTLRCAAMVLRAWISLDVNLDVMFLRHGFIHVGSVRSSRILVLKFLRHYVMISSCGWDGRLGGRQVVGRL